MTYVMNMTLTSLLYKSIYVVGKRNNLAKPAPLMLCRSELPYVAQADHLGNVLTERFPGPDIAELLCPEIMEMLQFLGLEFVVMLKRSLIRILGICQTCFCI